MIDFFNNVNLWLDGVGTQRLTNQLGDRKELAFKILKDVNNKKFIGSSKNKMYRFINLDSNQFNLLTQGKSITLSNFYMSSWTTNKRVALWFFNELGKHNAVIIEKDIPNFVISIDKMKLFLNKNPNIADEADVSWIEDNEDSELLVPDTMDLRKIIFNEIYKFKK